MRPTGSAPSSGAQHVRERPMGRLDRGAGEIDPEVGGQCLGIGDRAGARVRATAWPPRGRGRRRRRPRPRPPPARSRCRPTARSRRRRTRSSTGSPGCPAPAPRRPRPPGRARRPPAAAGRRPLAREAPDSTTGTAAAGRGPLDVDVDVDDEHLLGELPGSAHHRAPRRPRRPTPRRTRARPGHPPGSRTRWRSRSRRCARPGPPDAPRAGPGSTGEALRLTSRRAPEAACSAIGPPGNHMSSQMVMPTGTPATSTREAAPSPAANQRCSSNTP